MLRTSIICGPKASHGSGDAFRNKSLRIAGMMHSAVTTNARAPRAPIEDTFYPDTLVDLLQQGVLSRDMRLLVACGGTYDRDVLVRLGFTNVTISNLDTRLQ